MDLLLSALLNLFVSTTVYETHTITRIEPQGELHQESPKPSIVQQTAILKRIYQLESSSGRNDSCRQSGKFNGYGFGQNTFTWNCFDSLEEVETKVANWFEENLKKYSMEQSLCLYNTGYATQGCPYSWKYADLNI